MKRYKVTQYFTQLGISVTTKIKTEKPLSQLLKEYREHAKLIGSKNTTIKLINSERQ